MLRLLDGDQARNCAVRAIMHVLTLISHSPLHHTCLSPTHSLPLSHPFFLSLTLSHSNFLYPTPTLSDTLSPSLPLPRSLFLFPTPSLPLPISLSHTQTQERIIDDFSPTTPMALSGHCKALELLGQLSSRAGPLKR